MSRFIYNNISRTYLLSKNAFMRKELLQNSNQKQVLLSAVLTSSSARLYQSACCVNTNKIYYVKCSSFKSFTKHFHCSKPYSSKRDGESFSRSDLEKFFQQICVKNQSLDYMPELKFSKIMRGSRTLWRAQLLLSWPEQLTFENTAPKKDDAEESVFYLASKKLKELGILNDYGQQNGDKVNLGTSRNPKSDVHNIYSVVSREMKSPKLMPKYVSSTQKGLWRAKLTVHWPETFTVEAVASQKKRAEILAAEKIIHWLHSKQVINRQNRPILYTKSERQALRNSWEEPYNITISETVIEQAKEVIEKHMSLLDELHLALNPNQCISEIQTSSDKHDESEEECVTMPELLEEDAVECKGQIINIITGKPYVEPSEKTLQQRSQFLHNMLTNRKATNKELPIFQMRDEIISKIAENQVLVISGEPGCGKTTQVPQYLLDYFISQMKGAQCNMVVTQPRRISAISIAQRIAFERGESVGTTVGYQVRLEKQVPNDPGGILFCSTGILLRRLKSNPNLEGISHVIVDEVHGRDVQTDFLLILLKKILKVNKDIRVVLMSATLNAEMFSKYFDGCPILKIPGFVHPVNDFYLPEICNMVRHKRPADMSLENIKIDYNLLANVVDYIDKNKEHGAILCFLPGWNEISTALKNLRQRFPNSLKYQIIPVHSHLSNQEQAKIFQPAPLGVRKIVLATNIAETSITVVDVVYVIDSGFQKQLMYSQETGMSALSTEWITRSNMKQRRGRAGRVQSGECYHLYQQNIVNEMVEFPDPEMHRIPLEQLVLDCKMCCNDIEAEDFLSEAPEPPSLSAIRKAVKDLQDMGILDEEENLTPLGRHVSCFAVHPRLAKALIYATFFRCIQPVLAVAAVLSATKEPFDGNLENKTSIRELKKKYENGSKSDHITMANIMNAWTKGTLYEAFIDDNKPLIHFKNIKFIEALTKEFAESVCNTHLANSSLDCLTEESFQNENGASFPVIAAVLCAAFYPHIIRLQKGDIQRGKVVHNKIKLKTLDGHVAHIVGNSVLAKGTSVTSPSWLTFCSSMWSDDRNGVLIREATVVPPLALLLVAGKNVAVYHKHEGELMDKVVLVVDNHRWMQFSCTEKEAQVLLAYRKCLHDLLHWWIVHSATPDENAQLKHLAGRAVVVFERMLCHSSVDQFDKCTIDESDDSDEEQSSELPSR